MILDHRLVTKVSQPPHVAQRCSTRPSQAAAGVGRGLKPTIASATVCGVPRQHDSSCVELLTLQTLETTKPPTGLTTEPPMGLRPLGLGLLLAESMSEVRLSEVGGAPKQLGEIIVGRAPQDKAAGLLG